MQSFTARISETSRPPGRIYAPRSLSALSSRTQSTSARRYCFRSLPIRSRSQCQKFVRAEFTVAGLSLVPTAWSEVCRAGVALSTIPSSGADPIVDLLGEVVLGSESVSLCKLNVDS